MNDIVDPALKKQELCGHKRTGEMYGMEWSQGTDIIEVCFDCGKFLRVNRTVKLKND